MSDVIRKQAGKYGTDIVVQGSRARFTARIDSDLDIAIRVNDEQFQAILKERFKTPNPGTAAEKTMRHAAETGKIQRGELGLSGAGKDAARITGLPKVDISVIRIGGQFDNGPFIPLPPQTPTPTPTP
jgi:hypothetical protein